MGAKYWSLSNTQKQRGQLSQTREFLGIAEKNTISCCIVIVPITIDVKQAVLAAHNLVGKENKNNSHPNKNSIRSFEVWWNGTQKQLKIVLSAQSEQDLENFRNSFSIMYPNASFVKLDNITPDWYDPKTQYKIFDGGIITDITQLY